MTGIANCPICGSECTLDESCFDNPIAHHVGCWTCHYRGPRRESEQAIAAHNALCADVTLARNLRKVTREGHVQCGPGKDRKTFAAACLARPNLLGVEIIRGRCAWNDTLDAALDELAAKIGGTQ